MMPGSAMLTVEGRTDDNTLTLRLLRIRSGVTLLGRTTTPLSTWKRISTWAGLLPYLRPISTTLGSSNREGSPGLAQGRSGEPKGL